MSGITLKNPIVNSVPIAIAIGRKGVDDNGKSLSTGLKADNDVVSTFLGQGLGDKAKILTKVLGNMGYSSNALRITKDSLDSIATTFSDMLSVIAQTGGSKAATRTLDDILQQKIKTVEQQIKSAEFDGRKLLTGDLGSDPTVRSKFDTKVVNVRSGIPVAGNFAGSATAGVSSINITNNANIATGAGGDSITVGTITFKFVEASPDYTKNQVLKGANEAETAQNIATSIKNNQDESIRGYFVDVLGNSVVIGQRSPGASTSVGIMVTSTGRAMAVTSPTESATINFIGGANFATASAVGDSITLAGVTFTYAAVAAQSTVNTSTVLHGVDRGESVTNLFDAIQTHPVTKDLINRGLLVVKNAGASLFVRTPANLVDLRLTASNIARNSVTTTDLSQEITRTIRFTAAAADTETVIVAGKSYAFRDAGAVLPYSLGNGTASANASAALLNTALNDVASPLRSLIDAGLLTITVAADTVTIVSRVGDLLGASDGAQGAGVILDTHGNAATTFATPVNNTQLVSPFIAKAGAIDVSGIRNIEGFISNSLTPTFEVTNHAHSNGGDNSAVNLYTQLTGSAPVGAGNGDVTIAMTAKMAGRSFQAIVFRANGGNLNNRLIQFTEKSTGESFTVKTGAAWNPIVTTDENAKTNVAHPIQTLFANAVFAQTRDLTINTDAGDIVVNGASVGSVEGMTVSLNSTNFNDKKFESFVITSATNNVPGSVKFTATISGINYVADNVSTTNLVKGTALLLKQEGGDDVLTINIGEKGLTKLRDVANYAPISEAIKAALTSSGSGLDVRVGLSFDDILKIKVPDVSTNKLYRDNAGIFHEKLTVLDEASAKKAQEVITNALNEVRAAQARVQGQSETVAAASTSLSSAIGVTKDASAGYLDTDLVQAASAFAASLKSILAAISTLQAGARVADAGLEIIKSAAA